MNTKIKRLLLVPAAVAVLLIALTLAGCAGSAGADNGGSASSPATTDSGSGTTTSASTDSEPSTSTSASTNDDTTQTGSEPTSSDAGEPTETAVVYENTQYGFDFTLPDSWCGYTIVTEQWEGVINDDQGESVVQTGPEILIRHPLWTEADPRQDIPIMVFTLAQWDSLENEEFHIGAAPILPSELGHNSKYVFALPARYNFAFLTGYEEVETILNNNSLQPTENFSN